MQPQPITVAQAMDCLKKAMQADPADYAWTWQCNLACCIMDEKVDHATANRAALRFMKMCFDVIPEEPGSPKVASLSSQLPDEPQIQEGQP